MLKNISVQNFKSFKDVSYDPVTLNVLMGLNGVGKSSFTQMLLLLKQIARQNKRTYSTQGEQNKHDQKNSVFFPHSLKRWVR